MTNNKNSTSSTTVSPILTDIDTLEGYATSTSSLATVVRNSANTIDFGVDPIDLYFHKYRDVVFIKSITEHIAGSNASGSGTSMLIPTVVPVGYRPTADMDFIVNVYYNAGFVAAVLRVKTTGSIEIYRSSNFETWGSPLNARLKPFNLRYIIY